MLIWRPNTSFNFGQALKQLISVKNLCSKREIVLTISLY